MIHHLVKLITVDGFFSSEHATRLSNVVQNLQYVDTEFGKEISEFNMVADAADDMFSNVLNTRVNVDKENSGVFRYPVHWIHFENFKSTNDWIFACALQQSTFNVFEHCSGITTALDRYDFNYRNLFEWDLKINYILSPGQGILFRPWLFHSFDQGLIQIFKLTEHE